MQMQPMGTLSVKELNTYIKDYLSGSSLLKNVAVRGEVSNVRPWKGSLYFTLKEDGAAVSAVMFDGVGKLPFQLETGMKVVCTGRVSVFVRDGVYNLYVSNVTPEGVGSLALAYEQLKRRLEEEGLFDQAHKKPLPRYAFRVGVITAEKGSALQDILTVTRRRFPPAQILLAPSTVQGPTAPAELIRALHLLDDNDLCDVIIIGRGGGSMEELWCFNDERLAREIYACRTPIISGVGHETDFTICDYVADLRAPTPSAAAEKAVPEVRELLSRLYDSKTRLNSLVSRQLQFLSQRLQALASRPVLASPQTYLDDKRLELAQTEERLYRAANLFLERRAQRLHVLEEKVRTLDPLAVLERGYAVVYDEAGGILRDASALSPGDRFTVRLAEGSMKGRKEE